MLTTAHKYKGRETSLVQLCHDFIDISSGDHPNPATEVDEYNLVCEAAGVQVCLPLPAGNASVLTAPSPCSFIRRGRDARDAGPGAARVAS